MSLELRAIGSSSLSAKYALVTILLNTYFTPIIPTKTQLR